MGCTDLRDWSLSVKEIEGMEMETETQTTPTVLKAEPRIAVVGIGGAGCNVINDVYWADGSLYTIAINTDKQSLRQTRYDKRVCLCKDVTKGEGAKGDALLGKRCAEAHKKDIMDAIADFDTVILVAGMGGGTGTGVAPVVANIARSLNKITIMIAIRPFSFETQRAKVAGKGIAKLSSICPMTVVIDNDRVAKVLPDSTLNDAFRTVNGSIVRFIAEQKKKLSDAMNEQVKNIGGLMEEGGERHSLSAYVSDSTPA